MNQTSNRKFVGAIRISHDILNQGAYMVDI